VDVLDEKHRRALERDLLHEAHGGGMQLLSRVERVELGRDVETE
jgi:hypothetical protein